ncbi:type I-F CRISPR-associated helicase Cas3f [Pseudomonas sp. F1_0610]|uniref:type I-F CRISPR-associated helicase Cas3f n=1 Tax=Pseudomonas sp. F1_0610 TaxID=3114284 RepID=UPI0039C39690
MIVTFVSQCEKRAIARTRKVLDAFANRIGDNTWQTVITEEGLLAVKKLLRQTVTKNTAVSCHWIRSRRRSDLLWIVGNRNRFNSLGHVPVNTTQKKLVVKESENDWCYLPLIKGLTGISALLHDWGKCSDLFQEKLVAKKGKFLGDPLRHEWISCLLLQSLIDLSGDTTKDDAWLGLLAENTWTESALLERMTNLFEETKFEQLTELPPLAQMLVWIVMTHHKMPDTQDFKQYSDTSIVQLSKLLTTIKASWGYKNKIDDSFNKRLPKCFTFKQGLLAESSEWIAALKRWARKLLFSLDKIQEIIDNGSWRLVIQYSRACLMLGDHYFSSLPKASFSKLSKTTNLMANTDKVNGGVKQYLDEHLLGVYQHGLKASQYLKNLTLDMPFAHDLRKIKSKSPTQFMWQDNAVKSIKDFRKKDVFSFEQGWFIVNMASTGTGKTIANAKIMQALSEDADSLRYILALGLRTLTLQTGDAYRDQLGMEKEDLAVLIGSKAVQELHDQHKKLKHTEENVNYEEIGSESLEELLNEEIDFPDEQFFPEFLNILFPPNKPNQAKRNKAFLYQPVLVCTIDHIMGATETIRGGKYLLPYLRLLSSDLVIDEVDDFNVDDLIPLSRLIHLAGMLGRKVMISSATIPPSLATNLYHAYQKGFQLFCCFHQIKNLTVNAMWVDEFSTKIKALSLSRHKADSHEYCANHDEYIEKRCQELYKQKIKQRAHIISCAHLLAKKEVKQDNNIQDQYFELIKENIQQLHQKHHTVDVVSGKKISFGVVRVANIQPCVALTRYLLNADWDQNNSPKVMAYHSRQVLLLRSVQEQHLDEVLSRKEKTGEMPKAFDHTYIRQQIDAATTDNLIFILVATPVEEVGRDHDFDWAVIEPSSYRSIIQLSGRVLRHRKPDTDITNANIALMQFNLKGLYNRPIAFNRPGFESERFSLESKSLTDLIEHEQSLLNISAIPRIREASVLQPSKKLADLEHEVTHFKLGNKKGGPRFTQGWLEEIWFLTALPQRFHRFRQNEPSVQLFWIYNDETFSFCTKTEEGIWLNRQDWYGIKPIELSPLEQSRIWFKRDYSSILQAYSAPQAGLESDIDYLMQRISQRYGEIMLPEPQGSELKSYTYSDDLGLFD